MLFNILCVISVKLITAVAVEILEHPEYYYKVAEGETVAINCKYDSEVSCAWFKNGSRIAITGRYKYQRPIYNEKTKDCGIIINPVQSNDRASWVCSNKQDSSGNHVKLSKPAWLQVEVLFLVQQPPEQLSCKLNENVTLPCIWNTAVDCNWTHDNQNVTKKERYLFNEKECDCSMEISSVQEEDEGKWQCFYGQNECIASQEANLNLIRKPDSLHCICSKSIQCSGQCLKYNLNNDVAVECLSKNGHPPPKLTWRLHHLQTRNDFIFIAKDNNLEANRISISESNYEFLHDNFFNYSFLCVAEHPFGTEKVPIHFFSKQTVKETQKIQSDAKETTSKPTPNHVFSTHSSKAIETIGKPFTICHLTLLLTLLDLIK